jgi:RNA polymerase sigma-70 factor (ECF subfamily)
VLPDGIDEVFDAWAVREAIDALPDLEREVVRLQHLESLTQPEIADRLGVPVGTVKSRSFRAHRALAARLGHLRGDAR